MKTGLDYITAERNRHFDEEGWTIERDTQYVYNELGRASAAYAAHQYLEKKEILIGMYDVKETDIPEIWPWEDESWKPTPDDRIRELSKAGALIAAAIDVELAKERKS